MLRELRIRNVASIDELTLPFGPCLNVLTGETGAGKSVILQSLALLCGARSTADLVRGGADSASVEGLFELAAFRALLPEIGFDESDEVLIRRVVPRSGKGRIHVNGSPATLTQLGKLAAHLVRVYGQHEQTRLLRPANHLELLDRFAGLDTDRERMAEVYANLEQARRRVLEIDARRHKAATRREWLEVQVSELSTADPQPNEEGEMRAGPGAPCAPAAATS